MSRDGFVVLDLYTSEEVEFIPCTLEGSQRERSLAGLLRNMDMDRFCAGDTRNGAGEGRESS